MLKNPYLNAFLAALYIVGVVFLMGKVTSVTHEKETLLVPMTMLSLFVLSVAKMTALFFFTPVKLLLENQKEEALNFFLRTLGTFAVCVFVFIMLVLII